MREIQFREAICEASGEASAEGVGGCIGAHCTSSRSRRRAGGLPWHKRVIRVVAAKGEAGRRIEVDKTDPMTAVAQRLGDREPVGDVAAKGRFFT